MSMVRGPQRSPRSRPSSRSTSRTAFSSARGESVVSIRDGGVQEGRLVGLAPGRRLVERGDRFDLDLRDARRAASIAAAMSLRVSPMLPPRPRTATVKARPLTRPARAADRRGHAHRLDVLGDVVDAHDRRAGERRGDIGDDACRSAGSASSRPVTLPMKDFREVPDEERESRARQARRSARGARGSAPATCRSRSPDRARCGPPRCRPRGRCRASARR